MRCEYSALVIVSMLVIVSSLPQASAQDLPDLGHIVAGLELRQQQNREHSRAYTVTREYRFYSGDELELTSEVVAQVRFVPPNEKTFRIDRHQGSSRGHKIVKDILESEVKAARKDPPVLDRRSYEFRLLGEEHVAGRPSWVLGLKPRREEAQLLEGRAWIDKQTFLIHRVEGDLARTPSWWLKKIHIRLDYGGATGIWVPVDTRAVVEVRLFGKHIVTAEAIRILAGDEAAAAIIPGYVAERPFHTEASSAGTCNRIGDFAGNSRPGEAPQASRCLGCCPGGE